MALRCGGDLFAELREVDDAVEHDDVAEVRGSVGNVSADEDRVGVAARDGTEISRSLRTLSMFMCTMKLLPRPVLHTARNFVMSFLLR